MATNTQLAWTALRRHSTQKFSNRALAHVMATEGVETEGGNEVGMGVGEGTLRNTWLPKLRDYGSGARVQGMFDPIKDVWRYSSVAAGDFDPVP